MATILCIDDNANVLELHKALLERNGYTVLIAIDGQQALPSLESMPWTQ